MYIEEIQSDVEEYDYRSKWACFSCRKSFTRTREHINDVVNCPDCNKLATDMGYLFEPPSKRNDRLWKVMELLGKNGIKYNQPGMVAKINYLITGNNKLTLKMVEENINRLKEEK